MVVFSIAKNIPGLGDFFQGDKWWLGAIFSAIIGFLGMAFVTPEEVFVIITNYSAMGFAIAVALPIIVLIFFTASLAAEREGGAVGKFGRLAMAYFVWGAYAFFLLIRIVRAWSEAEQTPTLAFLTWAAFILSIVALIGMGRIFKRMETFVTQKNLDDFREQQLRVRAADEETAKKTFIPNISGL
jgi:hypothetical protein